MHFNFRNTVVIASRLGEGLFGWGWNRITDILVQLNRLVCLRKYDIVTFVCTMYLSRSIYEISFIRLL